VTPPTRGGADRRKQSGLQLPFTILQLPITNFHLPITNNQLPVFSWIFLAFSDNNDNNVFLQLLNKTCRKPEKLK